jgi:hypothetical protein
MKMLKNNADKMRTMSLKSSLECLAIAIATARLRQFINFSLERTRKVVPPKGKLD